MQRAGTPATFPAYRRQCVTLSIGNYYGIKAVVPRNSYVENLTPSVMVSGDGAFGGVIGHRDGAPVTGLVPCICSLWRRGQVAICRPGRGFSPDWARQSADLRLTATDLRGIQTGGLWLPWSPLTVTETR